METINEAVQHILHYLKTQIQEYKGNSNYHEKAQRFLTRVENWKTDALNNFELNQLEAHDREWIEEKLQFIIENPITSMEAVVFDLNTIENIYELIQFEKNLKKCTGGKSNENRSHLGNQ